MTTMMTEQFDPQRSCVASLIARLVAAAVLVGPAVSTAAAQAGLPRFEHGDCLVDGDWARSVRRDCGWLVVPESRDRATANTVRLAVEVFRAREPTGAPPLVLLHGGPAGPGAIRLYSAGVAMSPLPRHRDVVLYDQRGAGFSEPRLCPAYDRVADSAYNLREGADTDAMLREARRACIAELDAKGIDRLAYNTAASVADLADLRRALGYAAWDIRGASYGARLAQEAMLRDGQAIRAVVLASPVARSFSIHAEQPLSTQRAFERVFAACAQQPSCRNAFPHVERDFYAAFDELTASPVPVPVTRPDGPADTVWLDGKRLVARLRDRTYERAGLARIPLLVHELRSGDRLRAAREIVGEGAATAGLVGRVVRDLINCYDTYGPAYRKTLDSVNALARLPFRRVADQDCEQWLPRVGDPSMRAPVRGDIPTLIMTGHFDDRTPTAYARRIAATLSLAYFVELPDEGHDARPSACHAAIVAQFLEDPTRQPDTSCVAAIPAIPFATTWDQAPLPPPQDPVAITHVTVIDVVSGRSLPDRTVLIRNRHIASVDTAPRVSIPQGTLQVDGRGRYLIPGLWDMHVHLVSDRLVRSNTFPLFIANGITGVRDMWGDCDSICATSDTDDQRPVPASVVRRWKQDIRNGALLGPRIIASSAMFEGPSPRFPGSYAIRSPDEAREKVRRAREHGADFIKVLPGLSRESYLAVMDEAKRQGLPVAGHVPFTMTPMEVSDAGQRSIEHLEDLLAFGFYSQLSCYREPDSVQAAFAAVRTPGDSAERARRLTAFRRLLTGNYSEELCAGVFAHLARNGTWRVPTLTAHHHGPMGRLGDTLIIADPRLRYVGSGIRESWRRPLPTVPPRTGEDTAAIAAVARLAVSIPGAMQRAGVMLLAGTDEPNPWVIPGFSLHQELALLVESGLTPLEAIRTATINPARFLAATDSLGAIDRGKVADLVLLDADPLIDIQNTERIRAVVVNGRFLDRAALDQLLAGAERAAR
jgi:imidazolonepropionase-like amidohydrolase/pimeloyl-ACP methyl ester carboxylesterase